MISIARLPLFEDVSYSYTTDIQDQSYELTFDYNVRMKTWYMAIAIPQDNNEAKLVSSVRLVPYHELCQNYKLTGLTGYFWLQPIGNSLEKFKEEPFNISKWFELLYVYDDGEEA